MDYWLADVRRGQEAGVVKRFAPPYWTVNFPRPMMASVVTSAPDALRVDALFCGSGDLAGLIWEAEDRWDHPLLAYETDRDFRACVLRFRWRSGGVKPLDEVNGPTLTIEGRDAAGVARAWYVRLWNYAVGTNEDALITLDFGALDGGFTLPGEADPLWAGDIDRMFVSLVAPGYDGGDTAFAAPVAGWVELSDMACDGAGSVLAIGEAMLPEHGLSIATGYDDCFNQTPERVLRQVMALGYRGDVNHYVGMSHHGALARSGEAWLVDAGGGAINAVCAAWHGDFAARARTLGLGVIWSLSYELFDAYCPEAWKQRAENGDRALTGWVPPSTLLSPANSEAMAWLQGVAQAFAGIALAAGLTVKFQVGEPWWWVMPDDGRICLYDEAARAAFGAALVSIADVRGPQGGAAQALLDAAGVVLAGSTAALCAAVKAVAPGAITHLLAYLPTVLDAEAPDARRANMPLGWAAPAFDVLQLEDYDWVTQGRAAMTARGVAEASARLGYTLAQQHYFAGFVLDADDRADWARIAEAAAASVARGSAASFVWALPQVARDGFTCFQIGGEEDVQAFDDELFPIAVGRAASVSPAFSTQVVEGVSGHERRSSDWANARLSFDVGPGVRSQEDVVALVEFFRARRGAARGFRFRDPFDASAQGQALGTGDGIVSAFQLCKYYGAGEESERQQRIVTRPVAGSIVVRADGVAVGGWSHVGKGVILFDSAPAAGVVLTADYEFDVPVRFAEDRLDVSRATFAAGEIPSVPLVEIRE